MRNYAEMNSGIEHMIEIASNAQLFCEGNPFPKYRSISKTEQKYDKASSSLLSKETEGKNGKRIPRVGSFRGLECAQPLTLF